jgi:hypothetical protein
MNTRAMHGTTAAMICVATGDHDMALLLLDEVARFGNAVPNVYSKYLTDARDRAEAERCAAATERLGDYLTAAEGTPEYAELLRLTAIVESWESLHCPMPEPTPEGLAAFYADQGITPEPAS